MGQAWRGFRAALCPVPQQSLPAGSEPSLTSLARGHGWNDHPPPVGDKDPKMHRTRPSWGVRGTRPNALVWQLEGPRVAGTCCEVPAGGTATCPAGALWVSQAHIPAGGSERGPVHGGPQPGAGAVRGGRRHLLQRSLGAGESCVLLQGEARAGRGASVGVPGRAEAQAQRERPPGRRDHPLHGLGLS